jgi:hypothetical protein
MYRAPCIFKDTYRISRAICNPLGYYNIILQPKRYFPLVGHGSARRTAGRGLPQGLGRGYAGSGQSAFCAVAEMLPNRRGHAAGRAAAGIDA